MKKILFAISILILSVETGYAQTNVYHPFPDSAIWRVDYYYNYAFQHPCYVRYYFQYFVQGDTLINSGIYKKIYRSSVQVDTVSCNSPMNPPTVPVSGYVGALKDDPQANKTFFVFPDSTVDSLLYDYNLGVGDTLNGVISHFFVYDFDLVVISTDSVLINGQYRKKWNCDMIGHNIYPYIIEGIGSNFGLIEPVYSYAIDFTDRYLVCVRDGSVTYFVSDYPSIAGCELLLNSGPEIRLTGKPNVFPNPFSYKTTLRSDFNLSGATLTIINSSGQQMKIIKNFNGREIDLYHDNLPSGIYLLILESEHNIIATEKLAIVD